MNGYIICSFKINQQKRYLVLDVVTDIENNRAKLQAFKDDLSCHPFILSFIEPLTEAELLNKAFLDGMNQAQTVQGWLVEGSREDVTKLIECPRAPFLLDFIKENCRSEILASDIENVMKSV